MKTLIKQIRSGKRSTRKVLAEGKSTQVGFRMAEGSSGFKDKYVAKLLVEVDCHVGIEVMMDFDTVEKLYKSMLQVQS